MVHSLDVHSMSKELNWLSCSCAQVGKFSPRLEENFCFLLGTGAIHTGLLCACACLHQSAKWTGAGKTWDQTTEDLSAGTEFLRTGFLRADQRDCQHTSVQVKICCMPGLVSNYCGFVYRCFTVQHNRKLPICLVAPKAIHCMQS